MHSLALLLDLRHTLEPSGRPPIFVILTACVLLLCRIEILQRVTELIRHSR